MGAKEVKEWQRPGCWVYLFILSLIHSFNKFSLSAFYAPGLFLAARGQSGTKQTKVCVFVKLLF